MVKVGVFLCDGEFGAYLIYIQWKPSDVV